ncbi:O-antigen ligase family protein [Rhodococcus erythropolis]|uniref:O-antigen ligase family protein n=1 Tax=Rhodococcus erythropolis TaxID=1833 RepID=UPI0037B1470E
MAPTDKNAAPAPCENEAPNNPLILRTALVIAVIGATGAFQAYTQKTALGSLLVHGSAVLSATLALVYFLDRRYSRNASWPVFTLLIAAGVPATSWYWSTLPRNSVVAGIVIVCLAITGIMVARELTFPVRVRTVAVTLLVLLVLSLMVVVLDPSTGIDVDTRTVAYRGIFTHKNALGRMAAIEVVLVAVMLMLPDVKRIPWVAALAVAGIVLFEARSQTSLVAAGIALATVLALKCLRRTPNARLASTVIIGLYIGVSGAMKVLGPDVAALLSRDVTLTGRLHLWTVSEYYAEQRPLLGWGFGSVWAPDSVVGQMIRSKLSFPATSAHNGMLDIRLQIGWIGFLLLLAGYYLLLNTALGRARSRTEYIAVVATMVLVFSMDLTESTLFFGAMWLIAWVFLAPYGPSTHRSHSAGNAELSIRRGRAYGFAPERRGGQ